TVQRVRTRVC
ncbi:sigma-54 interaction domain protein, partial [Vibrio parahaemolyticus V-223/04]